MTAMLILLAACGLVLSIAVYLFREQRRERRETIRMMESAERAAADERAKLLDQVGGLLDRMSALIGRPWNLPPIPNADMPRVEPPDERFEEIVGAGFAWPDEVPE